MSIFVGILLSLAIGKYEAESYNNPNIILKYKEESKKYAIVGIEKAKAYTKEAEQLKRKCFEELNANTKNASSAQRKFVFVSLSQNKKNLGNIIKQAAIFGFTPVMRGFKDGSYVKTAAVLNDVIKKTGHGIVIDPESFKEFDVKMVPTFVVAKENGYDKVAGNVTFEYVMKLFGQT